MFSLFSTYDCKIDDKGRVLLPARLKTELAPYIAEEFILKRSVFDGCLEFWPKSEWEKETAEISKLNRFNRQNVEFIRKYVAGLKTVELDGTGRLLIPKDLIAFAGIEKDIVISGVGDKVEIWDKVKYEAYLKSGEDFEPLAETVMGSLKNQTT
jgi:MraZ protein